MEIGGAAYTLGAKLGFGGFGAVFTCMCFAPLVSRLLPSCVRTSDIGALSAGTTAGEPMRVLKVEKASSHGRAPSLDHEYRVLQALQRSGE